MNTFFNQLSRLYFHVLSKIFYLCPKSKRIVRLQPNLHVALYPLIAVLALIWFLIRVIPKPSRVSYPCQQMALGVSSTLLTYIAGSAIVIKILAVFQNKSKVIRLAMLSMCALFGLGVSAWCIQDVVTENNLNIWIPTDGPNTPVGEGKGIFPGRVVMVQDTSAVSWDGVTGSFWEDQYSDQSKINAMHSSFIKELTGESTDAAAWDAVFRYFNREHGNGDVGYQAGEQVAIKINMNTARDGTASTNRVNALPQAVFGIVDQLIQEADVPQENIVVYDVSRYITLNIVNKVRGVYPNVRFVDEHGQDGIDLVQWVPNQIAYSSPNNNGKSLPRVVTESKYLINYAIMKPHGAAGVTLTGKNHYGSIDRQEHTTIKCSVNGMGTYTSIVDLMAHKDLGQKTLLFLVDALYAAHGSDPVPKKWSVLNNDWPSLILASLDQVAIDSVGTDYLMMEFAGSANSPNCDNVLHEAAQIGNAPSGVSYDPEGDGSVVTGSLGVHEHWNNSIDKQYSRNLGTGNGIELVQVNLGPAISSEGIKNGSFENLSGSQIANWMVSSSHYTRTDEDKTDGTYCMKYEATGRNGNMTQGAMLRKHTDYRLSVKMKLGSGTVGRLYFDTNDVFDNQGTEFVLNSNNGTGEWEPFTTEFNSGEVDTLQIRFWVNNDFNGVAYLDQVELTNLSVQKPDDVVDRTDETGASVTSEHDDSTASNLFDNDVNTAYQTQNASGWVQHQFANNNQYTVKWYTVTSAKDVPDGPGANAVGNASFEQGAANPAPWTIGTNSEVSPDEKQDGTYSLKVMTGSSNNKQTVSLEPYTDYELSLWVLTSGMTGGDIHFDTNDKFDSPDGPNGPGGNCQFNINFDQANVWTNLTGTFNSSNETEVVLRTYGAADVQGVVYFDNVELIPLSGGSGNAEAADPASWTLSGSNNGSSWTTVDSRSGISFSGRGQKLEFDALSNNTAYEYYRLDASSSSGDALQMAEVELFSPDSEVTISSPYNEIWTTAIPGVDANTGRLDDYDGDGRNNLYEYAFCGNPENDQDCGADPVFVKAGSEFRYIYPKRNDDNGLSYIVQTRSDLTSGTWTDITLTELGTGSLTAGYDQVTNSIPVSEANSYYRLRVQEQ